MFFNFNCFKSDGNLFFIYSGNQIILYESATKLNILDYTNLKELSTQYKKESSCKILDILISI
jgi:hypothetical protein